MTYLAGNIIVATDYNGFVGRVNSVIGSYANSGFVVGYGWGQTTTLANVSNTTTITATQWATLNSRITTMANHTGTTITSRTGPVVDDLITIQANISTDIFRCTNNRANAVASGSTINTWSGSISKTTDTGAGNAAWTITFTHIITFPSADQFVYYCGTGGLIRIDMSKLSTGLDSDQDWNDFIATLGVFYISGAGGPSTVSVAGITYTGFTRIGGSGTPTVYLTNIGRAYGVSTTQTQVFKIFNSASPYTGDYVSISLQNNANYPAIPTTLTVTVTWNSAARTSPGETTTITGGSETTSPFGSFGTAPATLVRLILPSSVYIADSWGTPTISSTVA